MWVIIGQITWLHANYRHLDRFWPFLGHSGPQIPNLGVPFLANFFSSKYRHVGCPERCHVMPGLSAFFSNARDPLRGSKRPKSQFYGHYGPHIPIFGTSFSADLFSLQNMGMWGVQSNAMWCLVLMQPFQMQGNPLRGSKWPKSQFYGHCGPQIPTFWPFLATDWVPWVWKGCVRPRHHIYSLSFGQKFKDHRWYSFSSLDLCSRYLWS